MLKGEKMDNDFEHYYNATIRLKKENAELNARITNIKADRLTYCAYCGEEFPMDAGGTPKAVSNHIHNCPKHPIQDYKAEIERLKAQLNKVVELVEFLELPNLPSGHDDFIGYGAGKHDARHAILKALKTTQ